MASGKSAYSDPAVAAIYDRLAGPIQFAPPARDLVALLGLLPGDVVLDVGTGTGVAAEAALRVVAPSGRVVGVDASIEMLRASPLRSGYKPIVAAVPHLPLRSASVDAVMASFVITHVSDYHRGLAEMIRPCRPGGRIGLSAWGTLANAPAQVWSDVASRYVRSEDMQREFRLHIPSEAVFAEPSGMRRVLEDAGLESVAVETQVYVVNASTAAFLELREMSVQGSILRANLDAARLDQFHADVRAAFHDSFGSHVSYDRDVVFGVGIRPPS